MRRVVSLVLLITLTVSLRYNSWAQEQIAAPRLSFDDSVTEEEEGGTIGVPPRPQPAISVPEGTSNPVPSRKLSDSEPGRLSVAPPLSAKVRLVPVPRNQGEAIPKARTVRVDNDVPNMKVVTKGPGTLTVGRSARYVIELSNQSSFAATGVTVRCAIPAWVKLANNEATQGKLSQLPDSDAWEWNLESVKSKGLERLNLDLIPQRGKPFELDVELAVQPRRTKQQITIREAGLKLHLNGPESFVYDEKQKYTVTVSNPGTAPADKVVLKLKGAGHELSESPVGTIPPGGKRIVEIDLSARQVGAFPFEVVATGEPGVRDRVDASLLVRRGEPVVRVVGSDFEFAGTHSPYTVTVENKGNADLTNLMVRLSLPKGAKYISGLTQPQVTAAGVEWSITRIEQGGRAEFPVVLQLNEQGRHDLEARAIAAADLIAKDTTSTTAETAADLKLDVITPRGPQPIGQLVEYEIRVRNIGTADAREISVLAVCAPELSPVSSTGDPAIKNSQVIFRPIKVIERGQQVVYKVKVRAREEGSHAFRVAVMSRYPRLRFASEDTTRYYDRSTQATKFAERQGESDIN